MQKTNTASDPRAAFITREECRELISAGGDSRVAAGMRMLDRAMDLIQGIHLRSSESSIAEEILTGDRLMSEWGCISEVEAQRRSEAVEVLMAMDARPAEASSVPN